MQVVAPCRVRLHKRAVAQRGQQKRCDAGDRACRLGREAAAKEGQSRRCTADRARPAGSRRNRTRPAWANLRSAASPGGSSPPARHMTARRSAISPGLKQGCPAGQHLDGQGIALHLAADALYRRQALTPRRSVRRTQSRIRAGTGRFPPVTPCSVMTASAASPLPLTCRHQHPHLGRGCHQVGDKSVYLGQMFDTVEHQQHLTCRQKAQERVPWLLVSR